MKKRAMFILFIVVVLGAGTPMVLAQSSGSPKPAPDPPQGNLQRSAEILYFKRIADSGPDRGKEIYFFKCWVCHNAYTRAAGTKAPPLKDLYKRPGLLSGKKTNDESVAEQIRNGSANMPGYRYSLNDQDVNDLLSFLRSGKCCYEDNDEFHPPKNPRYKEQ